ncbi:MAG: hypothetical protein ACRD8O_21660 [Bryobacteraceae bacterium]
MRELQQIIHTGAILADKIFMKAPNGPAPRKPVQVTVLGNSPSTQEARIQECAGRAVLVEVDQRLPPGAAVKVEYDRTLLLGEVAGCRAEGDHYTASLEVAHALYNTDALARLARRLLCEEARESRE